MGKSINRQAEATTLTIKNMVCDRCIRVVREELEKLDLEVREITLGEAVVTSGKKTVDKERIRQVLMANGFELLNDHKAQLVEKIKKTVIHLIYQGDPEKELAMNFSDYLANKLDAEYYQLSNLFSSIEGITIERFIILQKIERVKELLKYGEWNLSEIAYNMGYSSVAHLSNQFKKITGLTPSAFKQMTNPARKPIDLITKK